MGDTSRMIRLEGGYTTPGLMFILPDGRRVNVSPDGGVNVTDPTGMSSYSLTLPTSEEVAAGCERNGRLAVDDTPDYTVGVHHRC